MQQLTPFRRLQLAVVFAMPLAVIAQMPPAFDAASIKPNQDGLTTRIDTLPGGKFTASNVSPKLLIQLAFGVKDSEISGGPGWLTGDNGDRFDIVAKANTSDRITEEDLRPYLLELLTDRFRLRTHEETRATTIYSLITVRNGPKLSEHTGTSRASIGTSYQSGTITLTAVAASMAVFSNALGRQLGRTVADQTGLKGEFDFKLQWAPAQTSDSSAPSFFTAVQEQLGLRLESTKAQVKFIVIDSMERPSEN